MDTTPDLRSFGGASAYLSKCPSRTVIDVLANKWTTLTLCLLKSGPLRFGELRRRVDGITQKSLTQTLRNLERDGLVIRTVYPTIPPRVEYELTSLGANAGLLADTIRLWAEEHVAEILVSRRSYDDRAELEPEPVRTPARH